MKASHLRRYLGEQFTRNDNGNGKLGNLQQVGQDQTYLLIDEQGGKKASKQGKAGYALYFGVVQLFRHECEDLTLALEETSGKFNITLIVKS